MFVDRIRRKFNKEKFISKTSKIIYKAANKYKDCWFKARIFNKTSTLEVVLSIYYNSVVPKQKVFKFPNYSSFQGEDSLHTRVLDSLSEFYIPTGYDSNTIQILNSKILNSMFHGKKEPPIEILFIVPDIFHEGLKNGNLPPFKYDEERKEVFLKENDFTDYNIVLNGVYEREGKYKIIRKRSFRDDTKNE